MKEPQRIPLDPNRPRTHQPKTYPLKSLYPEAMDGDVYRPDRDSVYIPVPPTPPDYTESKLYKIHEDFYVQSNDPNILKHYENTQEGTET